MKLKDFKNQVDTILSIAKNTNSSEVLFIDRDDGYIENKPIEESEIIKDKDYTMETKTFVRTPYGSIIFRENYYDNSDWFDDYESEQNYIANDPRLAVLKCFDVDTKKIVSYDDLLKRYKCLPWKRAVCVYIKHRR